MATQNRIEEENTRAPLNSARRTAIIEAVQTTIRERYVFPDEAEDIVRYLQARMKTRAYTQLCDMDGLTQALTSDVQSINNDHHLVVFPHRPRAVEGEVLKPEDNEEELDEMQCIHYGFQRLEILAGNIGYFNVFMFPDPQCGGDTAVAAMNFLAGVDALIIDLRDNGGGWGDMVALICSYFFKESTHLSSVYYRETNQTEQIWTSLYVHGPRLEDIPLYILTSRSTFSAAEEFAYTLKHLNRATIIGERTRGGAHPIEYRSFPELGIEVMVPVARSIHPVTGSNWQNTGVSPDLEVDAEQALRFAVVEALKGLLESEHSTARAIQWELALRSAEADLQPVQIPMSKLERYAGQYGNTMITLQDGCLRFQRDGRRTYELTPIGDDFFRAGPNTFFLQFSTDENGVVLGFTVTFQDGYTIHADRAR